MAEAPVKEKEISILNLSKFGRRYDVPGQVDDKGITKIVQIIAGKSAMVPESSAKFLLGSLSNGRKRYPDLVDAATFTPETMKAQAELLRENKALLDENAKLKAQLAELNGSDEKAGGRKK